MNDKQEIKHCPYCGNEILAVAKKCKHCGEWLPVTNKDEQNTTKHCPYCGEEIFFNAIKCKHCGEWLNKQIPTVTVKEIADYQKIANIIWLIIAIIQICFIVTIIAGIWNLIATIINWRLPDKILNKDADIPEIYESIVGLIVIGIVNLLLGGVIGVALTAFNFYIRNLIMCNRHLFTNKHFIVRSTYE